MIEWWSVLQIREALIKHTNTHAFTILCVCGYNTSIKLHKYVLHYGLKCDTQSSGLFMHDNNNKSNIITASRKDWCKGANMTVNDWTMQKRTLWMPFR